MHNYAVAFQQIIAQLNTHTWLQPESEHGLSCIVVAVPTSTIVSTNEYSVWQYIPKRLHAGPLRASVSSSSYTLNYDERVFMAHSPQAHCKAGAPQSAGPVPIISRQHNIAQRRMFWAQHHKDCRSVYACHMILSSSSLMRNFYGPTPTSIMQWICHAAAAMDEQINLISHHCVLNVRILETSGRRRGGGYTWEVMVDGERI